MWRLLSLPKRWFPAAAVMLVYLVTPVLSRAECSLTFLPMEESIYLLRGTGCEGIAAVDFALGYNSAGLSPRVDVMGGRLQEDNDEISSPGNLHGRIVRDNPGAGYFEVTVYFQEGADYPPVVYFVTAEIADMSDDLRPVLVKMVPPVPGMNDPDPIKATPDTSSPPPGAPETEQVPPVAMEPDGKAVFERFRDFTGEKNLPAFTALFSRVDPSCRQAPPVVITDGRQRAQVVVGGTEEGRNMRMKDGVPLLTVSGGRLISVKRGSEEGWIATIQPYENWWDVRVSYTVSDEAIDFPLTVAPPIEISPGQLAEIDERTFLARLRSFLDETGKEEPKVAVWFREYLFTANYFAMQEERERKTGSPPSR